ncbi:MAG: MBL fold metallo-hydrolase [Yaniella sp.]|uniref:MBL fold metallo-hydrolase n=1 Tax=Yaniella sp. TaxID=2773929 RepID=UPI00185E32B6|nr:MBL fold metallo-hydrolase [Yaniella sp.]NLZ97337.1 MBL fold metallo-hydrolase [Micrococcus sp.]MDN5731729.1 MBL fold metallo-hydrolase [Yaniella sp.]MDN5815554.1 MBL fold metallo-hydrolase [Yaniella sp.]MDN5818144.1 MBL fold metallo-hydrolase [Yaniella sp.]MDN5838410.1 MBL fold metallo-hydrolase [Yaniella sp.]
MSKTSPTIGSIKLLYDLPQVTIRTRSVSEMDNNVYLITSKTTGSQVLIDAADEPDAIMELLASAADDTPCDLDLVSLITTHEHWDHIRALADIVDRTQVPTSAGAPDADAIEEATGVTAKVRLKHGDKAQFPGIELDVIGLRGHTPGSVALVYVPNGDEPTIIFSGDSLFPGGVGNTWNDPERFSSLIDDVSQRVFNKYDDDTVVLPGHGGSTVLGTERPHVEQWRERGW